MMKRKMLAAREDLVDRISEMASRQGFTLFDLVNNLLELAIEVEDLGLSLREVIEGYEIMKAAQEAGFVLGPERLWYEMARLAHEKAEDEAIKSWFEAGVWLAKYYATGGATDPLGTFIKNLRTFFWNVPEFAVEREEGKITVRIMSPRFTESYAVLLASFLEGAFGTFNYDISSKEISGGAIRLELIEGVRE